MRCPQSFFSRDVLEVAPALLTCCLARKDSDGVRRYRITEVEAYRGEEDKACHASRGKTSRNAVMYGPGGYLYIYFIYGMHWMMNIVTGKKEDPQAALIRGIEGIPGPGRITRHLGIDGSFNKESLMTSDRIWIENVSREIPYTATPRIGIGYAGEPWKSKPWRFVSL